MMYRVHIVEKETPEIDIELLTPRQGSPAVFQLHKGVANRSSSYDSQHYHHFLTLLVHESPIEQK